MKTYKKDKRFAYRIREDGWINVLVEGRVKYILKDLESAFQCIYTLAGQKEFVKEDDFEEAVDEQ